MSSIITFIIAGTTLVANLPQTITNGLSNLGTLTAPQLPPFLTDNPLPSGFPWGNLNAETGNPYENPPNTGVIRPYDFTISRGWIAPDGVNKSVMLINGQFPGPTIRANWGDTIQVKVTNNIAGPVEGTALHWHGFLQKKTPWFDGVPSVQQCPIAPGKSFTYQFQADLYGTTWYHSHYSAQYAGGILGPIVVFGPKNAPYDIDSGPVFLTDHYHTEYFDLVEQVMTPNAPPPFSDNNLINGKMNYDCSKVTNGQTCIPNAGLSKFKFQSGKTHRLRLINAGAEGTQMFSIDGHNLTVIANDFVPIVPYTTNVVTLGIGQRTDVLVKAIGKPTDAVWMRSNITCSLANQPNALAAIYYENANTNAVPKSAPQVFAPSCVNDPLSKTTPFFKYGPRPNPTVTQNISIEFKKNATGFDLWHMNGQPFRANYDHPLLLLAKLGNTSYPYDPQWNVYNFKKNGTIRIIVKNNFPAPHPMHLHGHNFHVLATGVGEWDGTIVNPSNPQRRDVQLIPGNNPVTGAPGYLVIQFNTDNPGVWPFHCHIAWHVSGGLYVNIMERPDLITQAQIPSIMAQTCRDWADYSGHNVVEQIDSGL